MEGFDVVLFKIQENECELVPNNRVTKAPQKGKVQGALWILYI
jgi:hypothetical protein